MRLLYLQAKHYVRRRPLVDYIVALSSTGQDIRPFVMWKIVDYSTGGSLRRWIGYLGQKI